MKIPAFSSVAVFAEDYRQEVGGLYSLIGLLPDNMEAPPGAAISKLVLHVRTLVSLEVQPAELVTFLYDPQGGTIIENRLETETLKNHMEEARSVGSPIVTILSRSILSPFPLAMEGRYIATSKFGDEDEIFAGNLNVKFASAGEASED